MSLRQYCLQGNLSFFRLPSPAHALRLMLWLTGLKQPSPRGPQGISHQAMEQVAHDLLVSFISSGGSFAEASGRAKAKLFTTAVSLR